MYCKKCGTYNSNNSLRCKKCGDYFVNQYLNDDIDSIKNSKDENITNKEKDLNDKYNNNEKSNNNSNSNNKSRKTKKKFNHKKKDDHRLLKRDKDKDKHNKYEHGSRNNKEKEQEVIVKTSCFSRIIILFLILLVFIFIIVCVGLGLYILNDKVVKIPDVVDLTEKDAIKILKDNNLNYKINEEKVQDVDEIGIVLEQDKKAGEYILKNKIVIITIGSNKNKSSIEDDSNTTLENLVGKTKDEAINILRKKKIEYTINEVESFEVDGIVINQSPSYNSTISNDTVVTLYVAKHVDNKDMVDENTNDSISTNTTSENDDVTN